MAQTNRAGAPTSGIRRILRIAGYGLLAVIVVTVAVVYAGSEWKLRQTHDVALVPLATPVSTAVVEGARLARVHGCRGCHGIEGQGRHLVRDPLLGRLVAPAFARIVPGYSDAQLARLIRHGVRADGTGIVVMPSRTMVHIADDDVAAIIAWLRTVKPTAADLDVPSTFGPLGRALILTGALPVQVVPAGQRSPAVRPAVTGAYYYTSVCADCHGLDHDRPAHVGNRPAPALAVVAGVYDRDGFRRMLRTGIGAGGRDIGLMGQVARGAGPALTDVEIDQIHAYLTAQAAKLPR